MKYRRLGKTEFEVSEISLGTWQLGGKWGSDFSLSNADTTLRSSIEKGINFIDTADVYESGLVEESIGRLPSSIKEKIKIATKCGRYSNPHIASAYNATNISNFVENSLKRLKVESIDLLQLHCPPWEVYYKPEVFEILDSLKQQGKIQNIGVSVEKVEEGLKAIEFDCVSTIQIIFNIFRQRPKELFFREAQKRDVGIIVRVPLASGLLSGKFNRYTTFSPSDHRNFNKNGEAFDKGETFGGVDYEQGLLAVEKLISQFSDRALYEVALKWILNHDEVSCIIPGASTVEQMQNNVRSINSKALSSEEIEFIEKFYLEHIKSSVHSLW